MAGTIDLGRTSIGDTDRIQFPWTLDGVAWAGIDSVAVTYVRPNRSTITRNMTLLTGAIWYHDMSEWDAQGTWLIRATATDGSIVKTYPYEISIEVR